MVLQELSEENPLAARAAKKDTQLATLHSTPSETGNASKNSQL
jgi:hypothetical protein